jgi:hypothetical protein
VDLWDKTVEIEMERMDNGAGNDTWGYVMDVNVT